MTEIRVLLEIALRSAPSLHLQRLRQRDGPAGVLSRYRPPNASQGHLARDSGNPHGTGNRKEPST